jgi:hypothetical protein
MRFFALLLIVALLPTILVVGVAGQMGNPVISVSPHQSKVCVGDALTLNVTIADVVDNDPLQMVYGYYFELYYNSSVLNCTGVSLPTNHFLKPSTNESYLFTVEFGYDNAYNATCGRVGVALCLISEDESPRGGNGTLVTIVWGAVSPGNAGLQFGEIQLVNNNGDCISFSSDSASATVIDQPACALKTKAQDGLFYVPNNNVTSLKVELLWSNSSINGDQRGGYSPYTSISNYPDGKVDMNDIGFISSKFNLNENSTGWDYMADVFPDRKINMQDVAIASQNMGKNGTYTTDLTGISVNFNTGQQITPDNFGFIAIPQGAVSFNVTRSGNSTGAMIVFWH